MNSTEVKEDILAMVETHKKEIEALRKDMSRMEQELNLAKDIQLDGNGRILIPQELREFAKLEKKIVLVGRTQRLEIWSEDLWESEVKQSRETYMDILSEKQPMSDALKSLSW